MRKLPPPRFPDAVAVSYARSINNMLHSATKELLRLFDNEIAKQLPLVHDSRAYIRDGFFAFIKTALNTFKKFTNTVFSPKKKRRVAESFVKNLNKVNLKAVSDQANYLGVDLARSEPWVKPFLEKTVEKNVGYITNIQDEFTEKIENIIVSGVTNGESARQMRKKLVEQVGMSERRAQFVAVDQTGSVLGQMTAHRHQSIGIKRFRWLTSKDERVRKSHIELEGKIFAYDKPPKVGLPGEDFRCRCVAIPVFEDDDDE